MVRTTPNAVAQKRKTTDAAEMIEGARAGRVTVRNTTAGLAPRAAAASSERRSSPSHAPPTVRTTTARLKKTKAARMPPQCPSRPSHPSGPLSASSDRNITPTTTVGRTKGMGDRDPDEHSDHRGGR